MLAVGNCCYVAVCSAAQGASAPTGEEEQGHIVAVARLQLVIIKPRPNLRHCRLRPTNLRVLFGRRPVDITRK